MTGNTSSTTLNLNHWACFGHEIRFVGLNMASDLQKLWCATLGLNQSRLAKRRGRLRLICYLRTFVVAWALAITLAPGE
jgi:hypothetical protein